MLNQFLNSKPKTNLINLFLAHPGRSFAFTELKLATKASPKLLSESLKELVKMDFLVTTEKERTKFFQTNKHFVLYPELISVLRKMKKVPPDLLARAGNKIKTAKLIALTGVFVGKPRIETDLLIVGKINPKTLEKFLSFAAKLAEGPVNYTIMTQAEYEYRKTMSDRFVKNILDNDPLFAINRIRKSQRANAR